MKKQNIFKLIFALFFILNIVITLTVVKGEANFEIKDLNKSSARIKDVNKSSTETLYLDQSQEEINYGFWFEDTVIRWQEFTPRYLALLQIDLSIHKAGSPGNMRVAINDTQSRLWETTILEADVVATKWLEIPLEPGIMLVPETSYFIYVWSDADSPNPDNRYFWEGRTNSSYDRGITSVEDSWPNYDFTFRTWGIPCVDSDDTYLDQYQEEINYGFWFEDTVIRWQEFTPRYSALLQIDLSIHKAGSPGNMRVAINDTQSRLWETTILEADVVATKWLEIPLEPGIMLVPETSYFIYVWSDADSPNPDNRYFWEGRTDSSYDRGITSVEDLWPNYDFAFRTWSINCVFPTTDTTSTDTTSTDTTSTDTTSTDTTSIISTDFLTVGIFVTSMCFLVFFWRKRKTNSSNP
ncbi:MAG: hypothetical protein ACFFCZ_19010 [Promethearchaeota archaeon]